MAVAVVSGCAHQLLLPRSRCLYQWRVKLRLQLRQLWQRPLRSARLLPRSVSGSAAILSLSITVCVLCVCNFTWLRLCSIITVGGDT